VDRFGQNSIVLVPGANQCITEEQAAATIGYFSGGDFLLLQNEVSSIPAMMRKAKERKMTVFFNPSPMNIDVLGYPMEFVDYFIINEVEGFELTGEKEPYKIIRTMQMKFPSSAVILTLGSLGSIYSSHTITSRMPAFPVLAVDTTAAGDTFIGYFIAEIISGSSIRRSVEIATKAASICVTRKGAADSIPKRNELSF
jgi:ribokinase